MINLYEELKETAARRQVAAELTATEQELEGSSFRGGQALALQDWSKQFRQTLRTEPDARRVQNQFMKKFQTLSANRAAIPVVDAVRETAPRRRLAADLVEMGKQLATTPLQDETTLMLRRWFYHFKAAFRASGNTDKVLRLFIEQLQKILTDPLCGVPLDEQALLGSDGRTYGFKTLALHTDSVQTKYRYRSPFNPTNGAFFTTSPHPIARWAIRWLKGYGAYTPSEAVEAAYKRLESPAGAFDEIRRQITAFRASEQSRYERTLRRMDAFENRIQERLRILEEALETCGENGLALADRLPALRLHLQQSIGARLKYLESCETGCRNDLLHLQAMIDLLAVPERPNAVDVVIQQLQGELERELQNWGSFQLSHEERLARHLERLQASQTKLQRQRDAWKVAADDWFQVRSREQQRHLAAVVDGEGLSANILSQTEELERETELKKQALLQAIAQIAQEVDTLEAKNRELEALLTDTNRDLSDADRELIELDRAIADLERAVKERERGRLKNLLFDIAAIAGSLFGSWALQGLLAATPVSAAVLPDGFAMGIRKPF